MIAGIPGTGIGGMLYMLMALWMVVLESRAALRGQSTRTRWRTVYPLAGVALGMLVMIWLTVLTITAVLPPSDLALPRLLGIGAHHTNVAAMLSIAGLGSALVILALLMLGIHVARRCCAATTRRERDRSESAAGEEQYSAYDNIKTVRET